MPNRRKRRQGRFIVIDGPDGAGKTTQVGLLAERLRLLGKTVEVLRDPGGTAIGEKVREILLDKALKTMTPVTEAFLYMASRAQLVAEKIRPALEEGKVVLMDRFACSTVVYQGIAGGVSDRAIEQMTRTATGGVKPLLTVIIDIPPDVGLARVGSNRDRVESKGVSFQALVREGFLEYARRHKATVVVDGSAPPQKVNEEIWNALKNAL